MTKERYQTKADSALEERTTRDAVSVIEKWGQKVTEFTTSKGVPGKIEWGSLAKERGARSSGN